MPDILMIEEDENINSLLCNILKENGYEAECVKDAADGLRFALQKDYRLILVDFALLQNDAANFLRKLRIGKNAPVIVLSDKNAVYNRIQLLRLGADDYIGKPIAEDEVMRHVKRTLRQASGDGIILAFKDMRIDTGVRRVFIGEQELCCTAMEYYILELMLSYPHQTFSKKSLFECVTGEAYLNNENTMNVHISNLRKKIACITKECYIKTMYGAGYCLNNCR